MRYGWVALANSTAEFLNTPFEVLVRTRSGVLTGMNNEPTRFIGLNLAENGDWIAAPGTKPEKEKLW